MDNHTNPPPVPELRLDALQVVKVLGRGAMGTVFLVLEKSTQIHFALKVVEKSKSSMQQAVDRSARQEVSVLRRLSSAADSHPFLPRLTGFFENHEFIFWATPYCPGGDLNMLRYRQSDHIFSPAAIRFYLAEIVCALEHLHERGIAYRDLKPENILVQQSGHVTLTDFDLSHDLGWRKHGNWRFDSDYEEEKSGKPRKLPQFGVPKNGSHGLNIKIGLKKARSARISPVSRRNPTDFWKSERTNSFVGTEEYVAPEIIRGDGHEFSVDWWALGVLAYEMLYGKTPFKGKHRKETFGRILLEKPKYVGKPCALTELIGKLLEKDPTRRLGYRRGAGEIKEHEFFHGLRWNLLTEVSRPPFLPASEDTNTTEGVGGSIDIQEYFKKSRPTPLPSRSPSMDNRRRNVSFTEF